MTKHMETAHALRGRTDVHFNCCQSVLVSFAADLGLTEEQAFALGGLRGPHRGADGPGPDGLRREKGHRTAAPVPSRPRGHRLRRAPARLERPGRGEKGPLRRPGL